MPVRSILLSAPNNSPNPDATHDVKWGDQSWQEMMIGFFDVAMDVNQKPAGILKRKKANSTDD